MRRLSPLLLLLAMGCHEPPSSESPWGTLRETRVASYNVANLPGDTGPSYVAGVIDRLDPELVALQECGECERLLDALDPRWMLAGPVRAGVAVIVDRDRWSVIDTGEVLLAESDDGWGERYAVWAQLEAADTGEIALLYSTHFCVPIRFSDDLCTTGRQLGYVEQILANIAERPERAPVIVGGDLNTFGGFEEGRVVSRLRMAGMLDVYRDVEPTADGTTFVGNDWAPAGRIDYLFAGPTADVHAAAIERERTIEAPGLDHFPLSATISF